jgi:hypothetical protein
MDKVPEKKIVSVDFCHAVFPPLHFLTLEDGTDRFARNISAELPLYAA